MLGQDWALPWLPIQPYLQTGAPLIEYHRLGNQVMLMVKNKQVGMYNSI